MKGNAHAPGPEFAAVIWDLDGTLVDSASDIAHAVNMVLVETQLAELATEQIRTMIGEGAGKLLDRAFAAADGLELYDAKAAYERFLYHYSIRCCADTVFYPGIEAVLWEFHRRELVQGVCTNKPYSITVEILRQLSIDQLFGSVIGGDSTPQRKPNPLPLQTCIEQLGAESQAVLMVGDSSADTGAAAACSVQCAYVPWGYSRERPTDAVFYITNAEDLVSLAGVNAR